MFTQKSTAPYREAMLANLFRVDVNRVLFSCGMQYWVPMRLRPVIPQRSDLWGAFQPSKSGMVWWVYMRGTRNARNLNGRNHLKDLGVDGRIILKCRLSIVIFKLKLGPGGWFLRTLTNLRLS
jgi:hypothetical protein